MTECPLCQRLMCDHTPEQRGQTYEEMMGDPPTESQLTDLIEKSYEESDGDATTLAVPEGSPLFEAIEAGEFDKMEADPHDWMNDKLEPAMEDSEVIAKLVGIQTGFPMTALLRVLKRYPSWGEQELRVAVRQASTRALDIFVAAERLAEVMKKSTGNYTEIFTSRALLDSVVSDPRALDEIPESYLRAELKRREDYRKRGLCDYCGREPSDSLCKFPRRHDRATPEAQAYSRELADRERFRDGGDIA